MVASTSVLADRFMPPPEPLMSGRWRLVRLTRTDAEAMVRMGIVPEDASTELLNGWIVLKDRSASNQDPTMIGQDQRRCVERLSALRKLIDGPGRHVESQQPLVCSETHVPEPDFMVLRGTLDDYADLPAATDAFCVIEVADSSFERDIGEKLIGYAKSGVLQYIVINLRNRTASVFTGPDIAAGTYSSPRIVMENDTLALRVGDGEFYSVQLRDLLP
jgi:Uma2 family endonuclease